MSRTGPGWPSSIRQWRGASGLGRIRSALRRDCSPGAARTNKRLCGPLSGSSRTFVTAWLWPNGPDRQSTCRSRRWQTPSCKRRWRGLSATAVRLMSSSGGRTRDAIDYWWSPGVRCRLAGGCPRNATADTTLRATLLALFSGAALLLAVIGVYGAVSAIVRQRWHELGVRLAVGASPARLRHRGSRWRRVVTIGTAAGLLGAFGAAEPLARSSLA